MASAFAVGPEEAVGRIGRFWGGQEFVSEYAATALWHRTASSWTHQIYYGGPWWWPGGPPEPVPFP